MGALYQMKYHGVAGEGHGAMYIGKGQVVGVDVLGGRYTGAYTQHGDHLVGQATLVAPIGPLVTGHFVAPGTEVPINFSFPPGFGDGRLLAVEVAGDKVQVAFTKVGDIH